MTDRADKVAAKTVDACDHAAIPDVGEEGGACTACIATALRTYAEEMRREERGAWIAALCPHCFKGHILDNGRVWAFCGARKAMPGIPEEVIVVAIRTRGEDG